VVEDMKANELRIGNWVLKSLKSGNGRKIEGQIGCQDIVRIFENIGSFNYEPIPLTEEWLVRFGFDHCLNGWWCSKELINVKLSKHGVIEVFLSGSDTDLAFYGISYLHQLQNLYFAITGEELELKP
jgi:hypothetical protein